MINISHNPDVLLCLANLSNDEVFTPPELANKMLDMLPADIWKDSTKTFIDPFTKTGVFLREITKRLIDGLEDQIPDLQERVNHILKNQVFGIAITGLTAQIARRSLYCSKEANGEYSVCTEFDDEYGNIRFDKTNHEWYNGKCKMCGASKDAYSGGGESETHAYPFIHTDMKRLFDMNFNVIVGNPPYQLKDGGGGENGSSATPLYNKFIERAKALNPEFISMIIPARWYSGGRGLDTFRREMLTDRKIAQLHDIPNSKEIFCGVDIEGGVCYFLWDNKHDNDCIVFNYKDKIQTSAVRRPLLENGNNTFIRNNNFNTILNKVIAHGEDSFSEIVSASKPFGFRTFHEGDASPSNGSVKLYKRRGGIGYVDVGDIVKNNKWVNEYKVIIPIARGLTGPLPHIMLGYPLISEPGSCCTESFIIVGPCANKTEASNIRQYVSTKFFRFMVSIIKNTPGATQRVYKFVPTQDFSQSWTDEKLYKKYGITKKEIEFIDSMIKPMELK